MNARLAFDRITCARGGRTLFDGLSFGIEPGGAAVVTGANGIGKSSLLRLAAGLLMPVAGRIDRDGGIALADEALALDPRLPLADALDFWARLDGGDAHAGMEAMAIDHLASVPVRMLSTGQRKRAALARVIASGAGIWLLDEPGNGLDREGFSALTGVIERHREAGGVVLAATHQPIAMRGALEIGL